MKVSIIIHNYNRAAALRRCLESVEMQQYRPLQIVVLDANSDDDSQIVIDRMAPQMRRADIDVQAILCPRMGVAKSRNFGARHASGEVIVMIDNDACFEQPDAISQVVEFFDASPRLAVASLRLLNRDSQDLDPFGWVYRRSQSWSSRFFPTFTFAGAAFACRASAFWEVGGFWEHLEYSREEEELALGLIDKGWDIFYMPTVAVHHYFDSAGRMDIVRRRWVELRNGLLVLWRRFPLALSIPVILGRIITMCMKFIVQHRKNPLQLMSAVFTALREWEKCGLTRAPMSLHSICRYVRLHCEFSLERKNVA